MNISIIGSGYVGLVSGACLAEIGHYVICIDNDENKIGLLKKGKIPIYEPQLEELFKKNVNRGRLSFSTSIEEGVSRTKIIFIAVGTPPKENGEADLSSVCSDFDVASNPEFLREGNAIEDFLNPDRIVIGVETERAANILKRIYSPIINRTSPWHTKFRGSDPLPLMITDMESAELIKLASNSFLATKISFINAVADICERTGANVEKVAQGMGYDPRLDASYFKAGIGFGGSCLPKDLQAFIKISEKFNYDFALLKEVDKINKGRPKLLVKKIEEALGRLKDKVIGILGLAFKPGTDDMRCAPSLELIKLLQRKGAKIKAYDPIAIEKAKDILRGVEYSRNLYEAAKGSDALVIVTEWEEFRKMDLGRIRSLLSKPVIVDGRNIYEPQKMKQLGFIYKSIGRS